MRRGIATNSQNAQAGLRALLPHCCSAGTAIAQGSAARTFQTLRVHTLSLDVETINSIGIRKTLLPRPCRKTATEIPNQQPINSKALRTPPAERPFECRSKQPHPARTACNPRTHVPAMRSRTKPATNSKAKDHGRGAKSTIQELPNTSRQLPNTRQTLGMPATFAIFRDCGRTQIQILFDAQIKRSPLRTTTGSRAR